MDLGPGGVIDAGFCHACLSLSPFKSATLVFSLSSEPAGAANAGMCQACLSLPARGGALV